MDKMCVIWIDTKKAEPLVFQRDSAIAKIFQKKYLFP